MSNLLQSPELLQERQTTSQIELTRRRCLKPDGFEWFIDNVFSASFDVFVGGEYITEVAKTMEQHPWTMDVTGRDHFKSSRFYAEIMFDIFTAEKDVEGHYFSYNSDLSRYHLKKVKQMIKSNPFFVLIVDLNPTADALLEYWNGYARTTHSPAGLLSFKRGIHADRLYIDDPLKDPENKLAPIVIHKINRTITTEIYPMVNKGGKCRVVGTPQTHEDFFFNETLAQRWHITIKDVMLDEANRIALWPEWHPFEELEDIRNTIGEKTFNQEYRAKPAYLEESYIPRARLLRLINPDLQNQRGYEGEFETVGGYDIGKHTHPAHLAIFERWYNNDINAYFYRQLLSQWFDNWDYEAQLNHLVELIDLFKMATLRYDNTRGEFEGFAEQGKLPRQMIPVTFTLRSKNAMAANLDSIVTGERAELINDQRQTNQILSVTSDLQAFESPEGHGDSFWSIGMALYEEKEKVYRARTI
jgi:hypothetical protein